MKVQISLDDNLMERLDNYADHNYMTRSGLISFACTQFLNQHEISLAIKNMSLAMKKIADEGKLDEQSLRDLEDFERLCNLMVSSK